MEITGNIGKDYICWRIKTGGFRLPKNSKYFSLFDSVNAETSQEDWELRKIILECETRYYREIEEIVKIFDPNPKRTFKDFKAICDDILDKGENIDWVFILCIYAISGAIGVVFAKRNMDFMIDQFIDWFVQYSESYLDKWIQNRGGMKKIREKSKIESEIRYLIELTRLKMKKIQRCDPENILKMLLLSKFLDKLEG